MTAQVQGSRAAGRRRPAAAQAAARVSPSASYLTLRELLGNPHLGLDLIGGSEGLERSVRCPRVLKVAALLDAPAATTAGCLLSVGPAGAARIEALDRPGRRRLRLAVGERGVAGVLLGAGRPVPGTLLELSREQGLPLLATREPLAKSLPRIGFFLRNRLGAEVTVHGVLVEVFGVGLLILGPSGIGKSESALDLVTRGHRLIADDMVVVHRAENRSLMGSGSGLARYHMEVRGIGIIDVKELYGVAAVLASREIELVVELVEWTAGEAYERVGDEDRHRRMLDTPVPCLRVPVSPGRNIAVILELAARNHLLKRQGHHTARELNRRLLERMREEAR